nr:replication factor A protein 1-like [Ipomoea batatas]
MPSQYILAFQITPLHTRRAVRVRLVRTYEVPELRGGITSKSEVRITSSYDATKMWINHSSPEFTEKTVLNDFITGTVVISTLADLYMQTEEKGEVPTELETMIGKAMVFKINIKKENKHIYGSAFTVMRVLRDDGIVTAYYSSLAPDQERDLISKMIEECSDDDSDMVMM